MASTFLLKNINLGEINQKYGFVAEKKNKITNVADDKNSSSSSSSFAFSFQKMDIEDGIIVEPIEPVFHEPHQFATKFVLEEHKQANVFYDESEKNDTVMAMEDYSSKGFLPAHTDLLCFWCRHEIDHSPIGCPIKWVNHIIEKNYKSSLTKDEYNMKENISEKKLLKVIQDHPSQISITVQHKAYFQTDGVFCSFNCILAFIQENRHNHIYKDSLSLVYHLYERLIGSPIQDQTPFYPSPHWRLLRIFGGPYTIQEFREKFNRVCYTYLFTTENSMKPLVTTFKMK